MDTYVFLGPSLPLDRAREALDAVYLPPASQGDVLSLLPRRPRVIAIIDGFFERVPAVWHKEILLAVEQGVRVFGAASMGALRAAELRRYGVVPFGRIAQWYADGVVEGDDEVAVQHGPAEYGYPVLSEALVNVRATLARAVEAGVASPDTARAFIEQAREVYYGDRTWPALLARARAAGLDAGALDALAAYAAEHRVDQKREDALALLRHLAAHGDALPPNAPFAVEKTVYLDRQIDRDRLLSDARGARVTADELVELARLTRPEYPALARQAAEEALVVQLARRLGLRPSARDAAEGEARVWASLGCHDAAARAAWQARNGLADDELRALLDEQVLVDLMRRRFLPARNRAVIHQLQLAGLYPALLAEATARAARPPPAEPLPPDDALVAWYFRERGEAPPADLGAWVRERGFEDPRAFLLALDRYYAARPREG